MSEESTLERTVKTPPARNAKGQYLPGVCGNPGGAGAGRPKGSGMMAELERQLALEGPDGRTHQERIASKLIELAEDGDTRALEIILKRVAPERLALESDGLPLVLIRSFTGLRRDDDEERLPDGLEPYRIG